MNEHKPNSLAALVNALDQPLFALLILGVFAFIEVSGREASSTLVMLVGAVVGYFFRPKPATPPLTHTPPQSSIL